MAILSSSLLLISRPLCALPAALQLLGSASFKFQIKGQKDGTTTTQSGLPQKALPIASEAFAQFLNGKTRRELDSALVSAREQNFLDRASEFIKIKWVNPIHKMTCYGFSCLCGGVVNA